MSCPFSGTANRRRFLTGAAGVAGTAGLAAATSASAETGRPLPRTAPKDGERRLAFYGARQNGIVCAQQAHTTFAAFDVEAGSREELKVLLKIWTLEAARLAAGEGPADAEAGAGVPLDSGEIRDLPPCRLTLTFGLGPSLFSKDGTDRFGLAARRPAALVDLPRFVGDQLVPERTGGDLSVQVSSDDPQANLHAVRVLMRAAEGRAKIRWMQAGFLPGYEASANPRNLMGFKDGTMNPRADDAAALKAVVWSGPEGGAWMDGGAYVVARPIRIALEHWDRMTLGFQEQTVGRFKSDGAPLGSRVRGPAGEFTPINLAAVDKNGDPVIAENAHVRLAAPDSNEGAQIFRRSYSYDNGLATIVERWPPWRQSLTLDAGLLFVCYQRDPRDGFIKIFDRMSKFDMLNQFVTHVGGGLFACPRGVRPGRYLAQELLDA